MPSPTFLFGLSSLLSYFSINVYPLARLHFDPNYGSNGMGWGVNFGFPFVVAHPAGCFSGPQFFYQNFLMNQFLWVAVSLAVALAPSFFRLHKGDLMNFLRQLNRSVTGS